VILPGNDDNSFFVRLNIYASVSLCCQPVGHITLFASLSISVHLSRTTF